MQNKNSPKHLYRVWGCSFVATGVEGIEPSSGVLETHILPMNYTPIYQNDVSSTSFVMICVYTYLQNFIQKPKKLLTLVLTESRSPQKLRFLGDFAPQNSPASSSRIPADTSASFRLLPAGPSFSALGQALDRLVTVSSMHCCTSTSALSTLYSSRGLTTLKVGISHLGGGFTLRCLQRLSLPDLATRRWDWFPAGTPVVRPARSSRTKASSPQISYARAG